LQPDKKGKKFTNSQQLTSLMTTAALSQ